MSEEEVKDPMDELIDGDEDLESQVEELASEEAEEEEPEVEEAAKAETKTEDKATDVDTLVKEIEFLKKENKGLYHAQKNERQTRQELKSQLDKLTGMMEEARARRAEMVDDAAQQSVEGVTTKNGIPVSFDDDGNPYVDPAALEGLTSAKVATLEKELEAMKNQNFQQETVSKNQAIINNVLGSNEEYPAAFGHVQQAYKYLDDKSGEIMDRYGLSMQTTSLDEVMSRLETDFGDEFAEKFPGLDIDVVVEACTTSANGMYRPRKLQKALNSVLRSQKKTGKEDQTGKNLKFFKGKASNLSGTQNQKGSTGRTLNDIADSMSIEDFLSMPDADFKKIERAAFSLKE